MTVRETLSRRLRRLNRFALLAAMGLLATGVIAASFALGVVNVVEASHVQARVLSENLAAAVLFQDSKTAHDVLQSLRFAPGIEAANLATYDEPHFSYWSRDGVAHVPSGGQTARSVVERLMTIRVTQAVTSSGEAIARLELAIDLSSLYLRTGALALAALLTLLLSLLVSEFWLRRLNGTILKPIHSLGALMRQISSGSGYGLRAADSDIAELQELGQGFNAMLTAIGERDERLAAQRLKLERMAYTDSLTGLANREAFQELLSRELTVAQSAGSSERMAILFLDLDGFKDINDSLGHMTGDLLLQAAAERLRHDVGGGRCARVRAHLARLGGDEFTALLVGATAEEASRAAQCIAHDMRLPFLIDGREMRLTASIGIALFPDDGRDVSTLLKHADTAMYHAKAQGRDNVQFYRATLTQQAIERMTLETDLRAALELGQFHLEFQPQLDTRSGRVQSAEALIRWKHPERGSISPVDFIPVAERNGLIVPIGEFVLRTACEAAAAWHRAGLPLRVAVNLSPVQLQHPGLVELVTDALRCSGLAAEYLELEMTETALMENSAATMATLRTLRATGLRVALDDFGTGFSSMSYLHRMPLNTIKVDRSFVQGLPTDRDSVSIVSAIISMARSLDIEVTAEGVETAEQALLLTEMQCQSLQGWYIGRPICAAELARSLLRQNQPVESAQLA